MLGSSQLSLVFLPDLGQGSTAGGGICVCVFVHVSVCMGVCVWECVYESVCMGACVWKCVYGSVCMGVCA